MTSGSNPPTNATSSRRQSVHVAGLKVVRATVDDAVEMLLADADAQTPRVYALVNGHSASLRRSVPAYAAALEDERTIGLPDGSAITYGARLVGLGEVGRAPGPDVFAVFCQRAAASGVPIFLLGGGDCVAPRLAEVLIQRFPGLIVSGMATPPFGEWPADVSLELCEQVRASGARILWLGVSAPKQEIWALEHLDLIGMPVACVGAAFDFLAGLKPRAPQWMRDAGVEWIFRLATEPARLWKRYLIGNAIFLADLIRYGRRPA